MTSPCIYCRREYVPRTREHVLQASFGTSLTLPTQVCDECNNAFSVIDKAFFEGVQFYHTGENMLRSLGLGRLALEDGTNLNAQYRRDGQVTFPPIHALREIFLNRFADAYPGAFVVGEDDNLIATFPAKQADVGSLQLWDDGDEVMVGVGEITHLHIDHSRAGWAEVEPQRSSELFVSQAVFDWVARLFADEIVLWCSPKTLGLGGSLKRSGPERWSLIGRTDRTFVWSGPIPNTFARE